MYRIIAAITAFCLWTYGTYFFGHNSGYDKRDLIALNEHKEAAEQYKSAINKRDNKFSALQSEVSKYAKSAWEKYSAAQKEIDSATADAERWRVRVESNSTASCGMQTPNPGSVDDGEGARNAELPIKTQRSLERIGDEATRDLKKCRAKVDALQAFAEQVVK